MTSKCFVVVVFFPPHFKQSGISFVLFWTLNEGKNDHHVSCIVMYFHTLIEIFLRMMAGVGITVSRSVTEKFQL